MKNIHIVLSQDILSKAKLGEDTSTLRRKLYYIRPRALEISLDNDDLKKTFWLNIYNAFYIILKSDSEQENSKFKQRKVKVSRTHFSLNDIEHGILRKHKFRFGFGYIDNPFYSILIKSISVQKIDYRIHFALRCNQLDSYPIPFFNPTEINNQLNLVTNIILNNESTLNHQSKKIITPRFVFFHFKDFGGFRSIKKIMEYNLKKNLKDYKLNF
jgi:hypothetical protein